jgi:hypothetical protein
MCHKVQCPTSDSCSYESEQFYIIEYSLYVICCSVQKFGVQETKPSKGKELAMDYGVYGGSYDKGLFRPVLWWSVFHDSLICGGHVIPLMDKFVTNTFRQPYTSSCNHYIQLNPICLALS